MPITPAVLAWAIAESGLTVDAVASDVGVPPGELDSWIAGQAMPGATHLRAVARRLHRQVALFLLPRPPFEAPLRLQFRHPIGGRRGGSLSDLERRFIRRARRLQDAERWLAEELGREVQDIPQRPQTAPPADVAMEWRSRLGVPLDAQLAWRSAAAAFDVWASAIELAGMSVLRLSMGSESCRGFCLWDQRAPVIAVNDAWTHEARTSTLFHQLAHLVTRTDSACAAAPVTAHSDALERWCETFSAALLLPATALESIGAVATLAEVASLARRFRVSLRTMAFRLIDRGQAPTSIADAIPGGSDAKRGGRVSAAKDRGDARDVGFGGRTATLFVTAVRRNTLSRSQALDYLDVASADFERLAASVAP